MMSIRLRTSRSMLVRCSRLASVSPAAKNTPSSASQAPGSLDSHGGKQRLKQQVRDCGRLAKAMVLPQPIHATLVGSSCAGSCGVHGR